MNYLDIASVVIIMWATWTGLQRGLIRSLTSLIGWLLALVLGSRFAESLAPHFSLLTQDPVVQKIAAFAAIAALVLCITGLIGNVLRKLLKALKLGLTEQAAGGIFGAAKGALVLMIAVQLLGPWVAESPYWQKSKMVSLLTPYAPLAVEMSEHVAGQVWDEVKSHDTTEQQDTEPVDPYSRTVSRREPADTVPNPFS
jgi:membrane protein required for colicin V production